MLYNIPDVYISAISAHIMTSSTALKGAGIIFT